MTRLIEASERSPGPDNGAPKLLSVWPRVGLSLLVLGHLWAVVSPPLAFQTQGPLGGSPSVATLAAPVRGYGEFLYLNRGYAFFAPDPGPSHLIQATYVDVTGKRVEEMFPDRNHQWPRLLYHRHFMLTEYLHEVYQPPGPPEGLAQVDAGAARDWAAARGRYESVRQSYVDHLRATHPGSQDLAIRRIEHRIPTFVEIVTQPIPLADPSFYGVLMDRPISFAPPEGGEPVNSEVLPTVGVPEVDLVDHGDASATSIPKPAKDETGAAVTQPQTLPSEAAANIDVPAKDAPASDASTVIPESEGVQ